VHATVRKALGPDHDGHRRRADQPLPGRVPSVPGEHRVSGDGQAGGVAIVAPVTKQPPVTNPKYLGPPLATVAGDPMSSSMESTSEAARPGPGSARQG
jgi:hypothetical protein